MGPNQILKRKSIHIVLMVNALIWAIKFIYLMVKAPDVKMGDFIAFYACIQMINLIASKDDLDDKKLL